MYYCIFVSIVLLYNCIIVVWIVLLYFSLYCIIVLNIVVWIWISTELLFDTEFYNFDKSIYRIRIQTQIGYELIRIRIKKFEYGFFCKKNSLFATDRIYPSQINSYTNKNMNTDFFLIKNSLFATNRFYSSQICD